MTKLRKLPNLQYHTLIVCPNEDFQPSDWREKPESYTVIAYQGPEQLRGRADAWRFMYNRNLIGKTKIKRWAIVCTRFESLSSSKLPPHFPRNSATTPAPNSTYFSKF